MEERFELDMDGMRLVGVLHVPEGGESGTGDGTGACVVACHGLASNKDSRKYTGLADECNARGMALARFDFRGCGESDGEFRDSHVSRRVRDLGAVLDHVSGLGYSRLGLLGSSLGGYVALIRTADEERVGALVTLATPYSMLELVKKRLAEAGGEVGRMESHGMGLDFVLDIKKNDAYVLEAFIDVDCPTFVVHGRDDEVVPVDHANYIFKRLRCEKRLEIVDNGDHVFSDPAHLSLVLGMAADWFSTHLGGGDG